METDIDDAQSSTELSSAKTDEERVFNDPIHGSIRLHKLLVKIIDTHQFQRLRYIKQLGGNCFVYPGGSHSRFEHSIGVAHLAGKLVEKLQRDQPYLKITKKDVLCVKIAGLCHDLGHGPFSHVWDIKVIPGMRKGQPKWEHEQGSLKMFAYLLEQNHLMKEFEKFNLNDDDIEFIKELIEPKKMTYRNKLTDPMKMTDDWPHKGRTMEKSFLYEIVANKRNGIDVDKWDYFKRDCHHLGLTCVFDIDRAMQFIRVLKPDGERYQICFRDKEARNIFQMFQTRELLHRHVYKHKTTRLIEDMLANALILADQSGLFTIPTGRIDENGTVVEKKMSEFTDKPIYGPDEELYTNLTDHVFQLILSTSVSEDDSRELQGAKKLKEAKDILVKLQKRELYKFLGEVPLSSNLGTILQDFLKDSAITEEDIFLDEVSFDFGMKEKNPFDHIMFFPKHHDQDEEPEPDWIKLADVSSFLPAKFKEIVVRFYCKNADKFDEAKSVFKKWAEKYRTQLRSKDKQGGATPDAENGQQHDEEKDNQSATPDKNGPGEKQLADPSRRKIQF